MEINPNAERWPSRLEELHGFGTAGRDLFEPLQEALVFERLVAFGGALGGHRVAEEFMVAEEILGGPLVIVRRPTTIVVLKIGVGSVGKIAG